MKLKLYVSKNGTLLYEGVSDVTDAKSFGDAFTDIWMKLAERKLDTATSVGAVYELLGDQELPDLSGVQIKIEQVGR